MSGTWRGRTTNAPGGDWAVTGVGHGNEPGYLRRARERLAGEISAENGLSTEPDCFAIALELIRLLRRLDREPGNRVLILQRAAELERELGISTVG